MEEAGGVINNCLVVGRPLLVVGRALPVDGHPLLVVGLALPVVDRLTLQVDCFLR
jgi:hypothetical protein